MNGFGFNCQRTENRLREEKVVKESQCFRAVTRKDQERKNGGTEIES